VSWRVGLEGGAAREHVGVARALRAHHESRGPRTGGAPRPGCGTVKTISSTMRESPSRCGCGS
jgi:hypothetical protein